MAGESREAGTYLKRDVSNSQLMSQIPRASHRNPR